LCEDVRTALESAPAAPRDLLTFTIDDFESWKKTLTKASGDAKALAVLIAALKKLRTAAKKAARGRKEDIVQACRNRLCDAAVDWLDAAIVIRADNQLAYPPVLGTAGNEGRLDYTNVFMNRVSELLIDKSTTSGPLLRNALFAEQVSGFIFSPAGQFDPGRAGGFNQGPGIENKDFPVNPWNFVLALEGAVAWASGVAKRQGISAGRLACSPFTVQSRAVGYGSAGGQDKARAEIWMPVWNRPTTFGELRFLLREGRAEIGRKQATDGLQFAEAAASLGVDRGISGFVRYNLLPRRGDSYIALPATRVPVREWRETDLLIDVDPLLEQIEPDQRRGIEQAMYEFLLHGGMLKIQAIVVALGRLEQRIRFKHRSVGLRPEWVLAADDGSAEFRVAAALASIGPAGEVGPLSANLQRDGGQSAWFGNGLAGRLSATLQRRMMDAERLHSQKSPLRSVLAVHPEDACAFLGGSLDEALLEDLLFGLLLVRWSDDQAMSAVRESLLTSWKRPASPQQVPRSWALLKHLFLPQPIRTRSGEEIDVRPEPRLVPLLSAGRVSEACNIASRRLSSAGLNPMRVKFPDGEDGTRLAASLLIPVRRIYEISRLVFIPEEEDKATAKGR
jgi:CRISPR-associated protein Csx17